MFRRTVYDAVNDRKVVLSDEEMRIIHRLRHGKFPDASFDPYTDFGTDCVHGSCAWTAVGM